MVQQRSGVGLAAKAAHVLVLHRDVGVHRLHGDVDPQREVMRFPDRPHPAGAELPDQLVFAREDRPERGLAVARCSGRQRAIPG
jgi:hypothetical protein